MEGIQTLKGSWPWPWPSIRPYSISSCSSHRPLPIYQISFKLKKLFVDGRTDVTDGRTDVRTFFPSILLGLLSEVDLKNQKNRLKTNAASYSHWHSSVLPLSSGLQYKTDAQQASETGASHCCRCLVNQCHEQLQSVRPVSEHSHAALHLVKHNNLLGCKEFHKLTVIPVTS